MIDPADSQCHSGQVDRLVGPTGALVQSESAKQEKHLDPHEWRHGPRAGGGEDQARAEQDRKYEKDDFADSAGPGASMWPENRAIKYTAVNAFAHPGDPLERMKRIFG